MTAFGWDIGLEVGQSARTVAECVDQAEKDITVITNMLEARLLTGDAELFRAMQDALTPDKVWPVKAFFEAKKAEQEIGRASCRERGCRCVYISDVARLLKKTTKKT